MAASSTGLTSDPPPSLPPPQPPLTAATEVLQWLKNLPLAPEYRPTLSEFQDPIAYIFKIEKEASQYGICKIIPPVLPSAKKTILSNLNRSLSARNGASSAPTFTTRQQQIGFCPRRPRPVQKPVWQSGETYTFQEFETKAKNFEKNYLKKLSKKGTLSPLEIETLYWKATLDKPFAVEYANDMPGSAFPSRKKEGNGVVLEGMSVGETEWNMRGVSRAKGSLLRFMKEEIPGVTSPMVYIGMMFSWFAWHVEDHDLHSLNYMHMGAGKTWYGVPREAAVAFEEVVRVHGYGGEINPLVTFSVLGEKTTVMSPEVFISAGVPCCRLVQNAGEFVVTFPRAYHSGFSHGFNCGEAANIATPEWLRVAKDAAIRRASINYPPMVSHFQLLYDLALESCTRIPVHSSAKPRGSSRLKDKQKGEGETLVKEQYVKNVSQNNDLLHILGKGSSVVLLPQTSSDLSVCSNLRVGSQLRNIPTLGLCSMKSLKSTISGNILSDNNEEIDQMGGLFSMKAKFASLCERNQFSALNGNDYRHSVNTGSDRDNAILGDKLADQRLFSCVTCGILCFDCVAIIQPKEAAARYLMSADCNFFNDWTVGSSANIDGFAIAGNTANTAEQNSSTRWMEKKIGGGLYDVPVQSINYQIQKADQGAELTSDTGKQREASALGLLALNYGNSSDSEEDQVEEKVSHTDEIDMTNGSIESKFQCPSSALPSFEQKDHVAATGNHTLSPSRLDCKDGVPITPTDSYPEHGSSPDRIDETLRCSLKFQIDNPASMESTGLDGRCREPMSVQHLSSNRSSTVHNTEKLKFSRPVVPIENTDMPFTQRSDDDSSCMHVFCLEHAVEVEQQLRLIGGVHILLLCHPEYPRIEAEAKLVAEELGIDHVWNGITFRDASKEDEQRIQSALDSEEATPGNGDWTVKLGINLFYSANLSRSPLYSKQMPYNSVVYHAFGRTSLASSPIIYNVYGRRRSGMPKKVVAGKWCGKVWMSNQVHPFLAKQDSKDQEQEQERSSHGWATQDERLERKRQTTRKTETIRKSGRKRKMTVESGPVKKVKCLEMEDADSDDSMGNNSYRQHMRMHNSKKTEDIEREMSNDSMEDNSHQQRFSCGQKAAKSVEREDAVSDDSIAKHVRQIYRRMHRKKQAKSIKSENIVSYVSVENKSQMQHSRVRRSNQAKCVDREATVSDDDSPDDNIKHWHGRVPRCSQIKLTDNEDAISDDSPEESSHWPSGRVSRSKQANYIEKEGAVSDDSLENGSHQHSKRITRGKQARFIERVDVISDDSLNKKTCKQHGKFFRSKLAKLIERDDSVSDDSLGDSFLQQDGRICGSNRAKFVEGDDPVSDDDLEDNTHQQHRTIPRSKMAKFVDSEDAASDDLLDDDTHQKQRRIPKSKKAYFSGREDIVPDDMLENNVHWRTRKTPKGKQAKFVERDNAVSDDLLEDNSSLRYKGLVRNLQKKPLTLRQMKQGASRQPKQGTPRMIKKEKPQLIKQERQTKQETPQLRNGKSEQNSRQFHSPAEEELEGGPSTRLRKRPSKPTKELETKLKEKQESSRLKMKNTSVVRTPVGRRNAKIKDEEAEYQCNIEGCIMSFGSKQELVTHKRNICPVKGCGKKFFSHKYLVQHRRVHIDDRPLKCPWKGCKMTFKWAWARTEHIRVHTGARPYVCAEEGCGQTFRFVSDFSRHKRKTGHSTKKDRG